VTRLGHGLADLAHQGYVLGQRLAHRFPATVMSDAWVYVLRCADGSLYTGWSTDVARRLQRHNAGTASRYTASRLPVELVYEAAMEDRSAAMREEARIKTLDRRQKLALIADRRGPRPVRRARARA
jgi:putative endonuclease